MKTRGPPWYNGKGSPEARKRAAQRYYQKHAEELKAAARARYRQKYGGLKREQKNTIP